MISKRDEVSVRMLEVLQNLVLRYHPRSILVVEILKSRGPFKSA